MNISEFGFRLLLLFFPGIICAYLVDQLTTHRPREMFSFLLQSFVYGIVAYLCYWSFTQDLAMILPDMISTDFAFLNALVSPSVHQSFSEIIYVSVVAIIVALMTTAVDHHKWLSRVARKFGLTNKFGELDVWGYTLNSKEFEWVVLRDHRNDLIFDGWVRAFSDNSSEAELLLRDVIVYRNSTGERLYQVDALYVSRSRQDISLEFRTIGVDEIPKSKEDNENDRRKEISEPN